MDLTVLLSRIQFGFSVGFHIIFPTINIGLGLFIAVMEGVYLKTKNPLYLKICKFWTKIFALTFGMGVVSGLVMSYELGTNFGDFTYKIGEILGPLFAFEVLTAFFLEAGFLGVMLFGWNRVSPKLHYFATLMVAIGTVISAFWILSANSWMQYPTGYVLDGDHYAVGSWIGAVFNPTFLHRYFHMLLASIITSSFVIAAISGYYLLKGRHGELAKKCFSFTLWTALIFTPIQLVIGDMVGLNVHKYQPIKTAAIEANWNTMKGAPLYLFAIPDEKAEKNYFGITIPYGASLINTHKLDGELLGLTSVPPKDRPPVIPVFFSFRIMVGIGVLLFVVALYGFWLRIRGRLYTTPFYNKTLMLIAPLGFVATLAGWITAEIGRQPWIVHHLIRTADGAAEVPSLHVAISLALLFIVYSIIFAFYLYYLSKVIKKGPRELEKSPQMTVHMHVPFEHDGEQK